ncbi:MAG: P-loop NTPase [Armatimonadota bacterium]|nr:P-loop NTPase [Armatimonadota bacterium]
MTEGAPVSVMMAAPRLDTILQGMYPALAGDTGRFQVVGLATEWGDLKSKIQALKPEALLIQAEIAPGPDEFIAGLKGFPGVAVVVMTPSSAAAEGVVRSIPCVRDVFVTQAPNWVEVAQLLYQAAVSERAIKLQAAPLPAFVQVGGPIGPSVPVGLRIFAFVSRKGGVGKSTLAANFAYALARRGISTLLIGFDRPDDLGVQFHLPPYPNQGLFFENPTLEALRGGIQKKDALDILLCVPDDLAADAIARRDPADRGSIRSLVMTAAMGGWAALVLDLPPDLTSEWALQPLLVANTVVLVARPTLADANKVMQTYQLLTRRLAVEHAIPRENIFLVLNMTTKEDNISPAAFTRMIAETSGDSAPPVIGVVPFEPGLSAIQNQGELPLLRLDGFRKAVEGMVEIFYRGVTPTTAQEKSKIPWRRR